MNFKIQVSEEISLDSLSKKDIPKLVEYLNDPVLFNNTLSVPHPYTKTDAETFLENGQLFIEQFEKQKDWAIRFKGQLVGGIGILYNYGLQARKTEFGYWLAAPYRRRGIMGKVVNAFSNWLLDESDFDRIEANVFEHNHASFRILLNAGFKLDNYVQDAFNKGEKKVGAFFFIKDHSSI